MYTYWCHPNGWSSKNPIYTNIYRWCSLSVTKFPNPRAWKFPNPTLKFPNPGRKASFRIRAPSIFRIRRWSFRIRGDRQVSESEGLEVSESDAEVSESEGRQVSESEGLGVSESAAEVSESDVGQNYREPGLWPIAIWSYIGLYYIYTHHILIYNMIMYAHCRTFVPEGSGASPQCSFKCLCASKSKIWWFARTFDPT